MAYAFAETLAEIAGAQPFTGPDGRGFPANWLELAAPEEMEAAGIVAIVEIDPPAGMKVTGRGVADVDGVPTRTWQAEAYSSEELAAMRAAKVAEVKAEAERRILAIMPEYQQRNSLALGMELVTTYGHDVSTWPAQDQTTYAAVLAAWTQIKAIRAASNTLEGEVPSDAAGIAAFAVADNGAWPT